MERVKRRLIEGDIPFEEGAFFSKLTTMGVGGEIPILIRPGDFRTLKAALTLLEREGVPWFVLGRGANLVVSDDPFPGAVIKLGGLFENIWFRGTKVVAGAGDDLSTLAAAMTRRGLGGMEKLAGFPSTVGGALVMNAGAYGAQIGQVVESVLLYDNDEGVVKVKRENIAFAYRSSSLAGRGLLLFAVLRGIPGEKEELEGERERVIALRRASLPPGRHAGSIFKNPPGVRAWELIRSSFPNGCREGGAVLSEKHANVILNDGTATGSDVFTLIRTIRRAVKEKHGITLELEVKLLR